MQIRNPSPQCPHSRQSCRQDGTRKRPCILCIDDDPAILAALANILESDGFCVIRAPSGTEGIDAFHAARTGHCPVDAVITDFIMPGLRGDQVARSIKKESPGVGVVLLTGSPGTNLPGNEPPDGIDHILSKPIRLKEIRLALKKALSKNGSKRAIHRA